MCVPPLRAWCRGEGAVGLGHSGRFFFIFNFFLGGFSLKKNYPSNI